MESISLANYKYEALFSPDAIQAGIDPMLISGNGRDCCYVVVRRYDDGRVEYVGDDAMEPEDALFVRDLSWVVDLLNQEAGAK